MAKKAKGAAEQDGRADGLTGGEVETVQAWLTAVRRQTYLVGAAVALGRWEKPEPGRSVADEIGKLQRMAAEGPGGSGR